MTEENEPSSEMPRQGKTLPVLEAARRYGVSVSVLRRKVREGEIPGAFKAPGPQGDEWRVPVEELHSLGYRVVRNEPEYQEHSNTELRDLMDSMNRLMSTLDAERRQLKAVDEGYRGAESKVTRLKAQLVAEKERRLRAEAELATLRAAQQAQQEMIDELSRSLDASARVWRRVFWAIFIAGVGGLVAFFLGRWQEWMEEESEVQG
jgi:hypothetical protein